MSDLTLIRREIVSDILNNYKNKADEEAEIIKKLISADDSTIGELVYAHLKAFVLSKFMLDPETSEDNIIKLAELSIERSFKLDKSIVAELDKAMPCSSASSATAKRILLLYAIQKEIRHDIDPERLVTAATVRELSGLIIAM